MQSKDPAVEKSLLLAQATGEVKAKLEKAYLEKEGSSPRDDMSMFELDAKSEMDNALKLVQGICERHKKNEANVDQLAKGGEAKTLLTCAEELEREVRPLLSSEDPLVGEVLEGLQEVAGMSEDDRRNFAAKVLCLFTVELPPLLEACFIDVGVIKETAEKLANLFVLE